MMHLNVVPKILFVAGVALVLSCSKKEKENPIPEGVDTTKYQKVDSIATIIPKTALRDTILTIVADSVDALYYPNTGRFVMKLKRGDVCNITRTGRYDVVDGKGNFWIRVERMGGKGWIYGGHTSLKSDVWVFSDGMTELGHPYIKHKLNRLTAPNFDDLFELVGKTIERTEYSEGDDPDEMGSRKVDANDDEIIVEEDDGMGSKIKETFKPGPANDSLQSILYTYSGTGDSEITFNHSFIIGKHRGKSSFIADFFGELKEIRKVGKNYLLIADYDLFSSRFGTVHYTNVELWSSQRKSMISRQRVANSAVEITGYPIFKPWEDGSFIASSKATFAETDGVLTMEIFETYNKINSAGKVDEKVFYTTRYFTFNDSTNKFLESKQEVIYEAK